MTDSSNTKESSLHFCTECGAELQKGAKFCTSCGHPVEQEDSNESIADSPTGVISDTDFASQPTVADSPTIPNQVVSDSSAPTAQFNNQENTNPMPPVSSFVAGNTAKLPVEETLKQTHNQPVTYSAQSSAQKTGNGKKIALIAGAAVAVIIVVVLVAVFVFGVGSQQSNGSSATQTTTESNQQIVVELTQSYSTQYGSQNSVTYPTFTFKYPSSWSVSNELVTSRGETVELTSSDGVTVKYEQRAQSTSSSDSVSLENMTKVADASFVPHQVQGSDYSDLGTFIVVSGNLDINGSDEGTCYALVPASAMHSTMDLDLRCGVPGFWYASTITFTCQPTGDLSAQTEQELIAILASFSETQSVSSSNDSDEDEATPITSDYVLPDSSTKTYSESELSELSNYELYIARNEIFARHGRMFNNEDLQTYFGSKSWYHPSIAPEDFSDSLLNSTEKANVETMSKIENARGSSYVS